MTASRWRVASFALGALCAALLWRDCNQAPAEPRAARDCAAPRVLSRAEPFARGAADSPESMDPSELEAQGAAAPGDDGLALYGVRLPSWLVWLAPHPGEDLRVYRDRMLPLAVAAVAPQRDRVARGRDSFAALAHLDARQRAELDAAADETATALQDRVMTAVMSGELSPAVFKPMAGVAMARDLLDIVSRGNGRFLGALRDDQRATLAQHPFDFGDYLVFSTHWEDALKLL